MRFLDEIDIGKMLGRNTLGAGRDQVMFKQNKRTSA